MELSYNDQLPKKVKIRLLNKTHWFVYWLLPWSTSVPYIPVALFLPLQLCAPKVHMTKLLLALPLKVQKLYYRQQDIVQRWLLNVKLGWQWTENDPASYQAIYVLHCCIGAYMNVNNTRKSLNLYECILYGSYHYFYKIFSSLCSRLCWIQFHSHMCNRVWC